MCLGIVGLGRERVARNLRVKIGGCEEQNVGFFFRFFFLGGEPPSELIKLNSHFVTDLPSAPALPPDSPERVQEISSLISALASGQIDVAGLRKLSLLSKERPWRAEDDDGDDVDDAEGILASPTLKGASRKADSKQTTESFWREQRRAQKLFEGLTKFIQSDQAANVSSFLSPLSRRSIVDAHDPPYPQKNEEVNEVALVLFKDLVINQHPSFSGDEVEVYALLFRLRQHRTSRTAIAAVEGIADAFSAELEPLYGYGILRASLQDYLVARSTPPSASLAASYALGLRLIGKHFEKLPAEVLEEELPKAKGLIKNVRLLSLRFHPASQLTSCLMEPCF